MTTIIADNEKNKTPYRLLIEKDGEVMQDRRSAAIFGVSNDGNEGNTFINFKQKNVEAVICALAQLREIENKVLAKYPEILRPVILHAVNRVSIIEKVREFEAEDEAKKQITAELDIDTDGIPFIKFEED